MRRAVLTLCLLIAGNGAIGCEAVGDGWGLDGRFAEVEFRNVSPSGARHENWVPSGARLIMHAGFDQKTDEYGHGVLGAVRDAKILTIHVRIPGDDRITCPAGVLLPPGDVFEDIAPRLADLDGDGVPEVIVVHSNSTLGARLAVYDRRATLLAATPYIGRSFRWLAPLGAADLDGDGYMELAYIDRPHLAKTLRVWRYQDRNLTQIAELRGLTNHRIGQDFISGGIRDCGSGPEVITADASWRNVMATRLDGKSIATTAISRFDGPESLEQALSCN